MPDRSNHHRGSHPLSVGQQALLFLDSAEHRESFNIVRSFRVLSGLDHDCFARSMQCLVDRHEAFRTSIAMNGTEPVQSVSETSRFEVEYREAAGCPDPELAIRIRKWGMQPFQLDRGPLLRASWWTTGKGAVVALSFHHLIFDLWSAGIVSMELCELFTASGQLQKDGDEESYSSFVDWQGGFLHSVQAHKGFSYWSKELANLGPAVDSATDSHESRSAQEPNAFEVVAIDIPEEVGALVRGASRDAAVTPSSILLAAYFALLSLWTAERDLIVGVLVPGRHRSRWRSTVGYFANLLPIRVSLSDNPTFFDLLRRVCRALSRALRHQHLPFASVVQSLRRDHGHVEARLCQAVFSYQANSQGESGEPLLLLDLAGSAFRMGTASVAPFPIGSPTSRAELSLLIAEADGRFRGRIEGDMRKSDAKGLELAFGRFVCLLASACSDPSRKLADLQWIPQSERDLLSSWGKGPDAVSDGISVTELVFGQLRAPGKQAIKACDGSLTYGQLQKLASRIARNLRAAGVAPDDRVGLIAPRNVALIPVILGILSAGAAFVPLDLSLSPERIAHIVRCSGISVVLTESEEDELNLHGVGVLCTADILREPGGDTGAAAFPASPGALAYIMFTSGSTGMPKGVEVTHEAVVNLLRHFHEVLGLSRGCRWLALTNIVFDISILELLCPLVCGGTVVVAPDGARYDGSVLSGLLGAENITHLQATPTTWRSLLNWGWNNGTGLTALCGGEMLQGDLAESIIASGATLWNVYGPTETTIWSTAGPVTSGELVNLGRPVRGTTLQVLDQEQRIVPIGSFGELYIGGAGVARGYASRPELTARYFHPDPAGPAGGRIYKTGDHVRWTTKGLLEFRGRLDSQVKVRGVRIEISEVEAAILRSEGIDHAVVVPIQEGGLCRGLCAYLVAQPGSNIDAAILRRHLGGVLPAAAVPSRIIAIDQLPLTPSNKIDRSRLAAVASTTASRDSLPPVAWDKEDFASAVLAKVWQQLLGVYPSSPHEDFFGAGGDSLMAMKLAMGVSKYLEIPFTTSDVFSNPSAEDLARRVRTLVKTKSGWGSRPPFPPQQTPPGLLSSAQRSLWIAQQLDPDSPQYNVPMALLVEGSLDAGALEAALVRIAERQEILRTCFGFENSTPRARLMPESPRLCYIDLSRKERDPVLAKAEAGQLLSEECSRPFDLTLPPWRGFLIRVGEDLHVLAFIFHHILIDGWSIAIFGNELERAYSSPQTPALEVRYSDYAAWEEGYLKNPDLRQLALKRAEGLVSLAGTRLASDPGPENLKNWRCCRKQIELSASQSESIRSLGRQHFVTDFMCVLSAIALLLKERSGDQIVTLALDVANRMHDHLKSVIGCFVNQVVVNIDLSSGPTLPEIFQSVRTAVLEAMTSDFVPFDEILAASRKLHRKSGTLFQTKVVSFSPKWDLNLAPEIKTSEFHLDYLAAKHDLTIFVSTAGERISLALDFRARMFSESTMKSFSDDLACILDGLPNDWSGFSELEEYLP